MTLPEWTLVVLALSNLFCYSALNALRDRVRRLEERVEPMPHPKPNSWRKPL